MKVIDFLKDLGTLDYSVITKSDVVFKSFIFEQASKLIFHF